MSGPLNVRLSVGDWMVISRELTHMGRSGAGHGSGSATPVALRTRIERAFGHMSDVTLGLETPLEIYMGVRQKQTLAVAIDLATAPEGEHILPTAQEDWVNARW